MASFSVKAAFTLLFVNISVFPLLSSSRAINLERDQRSSEQTFTLDAKLNFGLRVLGKTAVSLQYTKLNVYIDLY